MSGGADRFGVLALRSHAWRGAAGRRGEVPGFGDGPAACGPDLAGPLDEQPVARPAAGVELGRFDPVVDDADAAAQPEGGVGDADRGGGGGGCRGWGWARAGGPAQVRGLPDSGAAAGLDLIVPRDAEPAARAAGGQLSGVQPVVDDAGAAAEPLSGLGRGDLAGSIRCRRGDLVSVADPLDGLDVGRPAVAGGQPGGGQLFGQAGCGRDRAKVPDNLDRW